MAGKAMKHMLTKKMVTIDNPKMAAGRGTGKHELSADKDPGQSGLYLDAEHIPRMGQQFKMRRPSDLDDDTDD